VIENAMDLVTKEKAGKFKSQLQKDQLSIALKTEELRGHTWAISSSALLKEGFVDEINMYKKRGRHDIDAESANNGEEHFATQLFNFMRKPQKSLLVRCLFHKSIWISALDSH
jgi:hypothetical protein